MAKELGLRLAGLVEWNQQPVPGAQIFLKPAGNFHEQAALAETTADADGRFILEYPPVGNWFIYAVSDNEEFWGWVGRSVSVSAGQVVDAGRLDLSKRLQLLEPASGLPITTKTPTLRWAAFPDAVRYDVDVFIDEIGQAVMRHTTAGTSVVVAPALVPGVLYQWGVQAYNAAGQQIAHYSPWYIEVQPSPADLLLKEYSIGLVLERLPFLNAPPGAGDERLP